MRETFDFGQQRRIAGLVRRLRSPADLPGTRRARGSNRLRNFDTAGATRTVPVFWRRATVWR